MDYPPSRFAPSYDDPYDRPSYYPPRTREYSPLRVDETRLHDRPNKSILVDPNDAPGSRLRDLDGRSSRSPNVRVLPSDDGFNSHPSYTQSRSQPRDFYDTPPRSRHDLENKNTDRNHKFRQHRRGFEADEGDTLRRAKSSSPSRAYRDPSPGYGFSDREDRHSKKHSKKAPRKQDYYDDGPYSGYHAPDPPSKPSPSSRFRPADFADDAPPPSRRSKYDEPPSMYGAVPDAGGRSRKHDNYYDDAPPPRRHETRPSPYPGYPEPDQSRYARPAPYGGDRDPYGYGAMPRDEDNYRARSEPPGRHRDKSRGDPRQRRGPPPEYYDERQERPPRAQSSGTRDKKKKKGKGWEKEAGKMFVNHALPVIKQNAVPLLMKGAQAYLNQKSGGGGAASASRR